MQSVKARAAGIAVAMRVFAPQVRAWRGKADLRLAFFGHGVFVSAVLALAYLDAMLRGERIVQQALLTATAVYTAWVLAAVWRCAERARAPWGDVARLLAVAWGGNALLVLGFLQLDLLRS